MALNGAIPEDMVIDSSLVNVSTIIGQGLCIKSEPLFPQNLLPKTIHVFCR